DAPGRECCALDGTVPVDGRVAVVGTRWVVLAHGAQQRTDRPLVELDQGQQRVLHRVPPPRSRCRAASRSRASSAWSASPAPGSARTTTRLPGGSWSTRSRIRWRSLRFTLLRTTAPPTALLTTKPARVGGALSPGACGSVATLRRCTTRCWRPARRPRRTAIAKSSRRLSRISAVSTTSATARDQGDRRARPLLRRDARIARPARVRIRSRKPWVFARRRLLGWKVRLLTRGLQKRSGSAGCRPGCHRAPTSSSRYARVHRRPITLCDLCPSEAGGSSHRQPDLVTVRAAAPFGQTTARRKTLVHSLGTTT